MEFYNDELQKSYIAANKISENHLNKLDEVSSDIKMIESFLQNSGFGEYEKHYEFYEGQKFVLYWDNKRLNCLHRPLIECPIKIRLGAYPHLPDFLDSIARFHQGECK
jgi:hypothetical protein